MRPEDWTGNVPHIETPVEHVMTIQDDNAESDHKIQQWQEYFNTQFSNLFKWVGEVRSDKIQAEFFASLMPVLQKGRRVSIMLQDKFNGERDKLIKQRLES